MGKTNEQQNRQGIAPPEARQHKVLSAEPDHPFIEVTMYHVIWELDVLGARTPQKAAKIALKFQRNPNYAITFKVFSKTKQTTVTLMNNGKLPDCRITKKR